MDSTLVLLMNIYVFEGDTFEIGDMYLERHVGGKRNSWHRII